MQLAAVVTSVGVLFVALAKIFKFTKKTIYLIDEMVGSDEDQKPGVVKRITIIETQLRPGDGSTMRDQVNRIGQWAKDHSELHERSKNEGK